MDRSQTIVRAVLQGAVLGTALLAGEDILALLLGLPPLRGEVASDVTVWYALLPALIGLLVGLLGARGSASLWWTWGGVVALLVGGAASVRLEALGAPAPLGLLAGAGVGAAATFLALYLTRNDESYRWGFLVGAWALAPAALAVERWFLAGGRPGALVPLVLTAIAVCCLLASLAAARALGTRSPRSLPAVIAVSLALWVLRYPLLALDERSTPPTGSGEGPPVLMVLVDGLDPQVFLAEGHPTFHELGRRGFLYSQAQAAAPSVPAAVASMFTGSTVLRHRLDLDAQALDDSERTLAELLALAGYATGFVTSGPSLTALAGMDQGFQWFRDRVAMPHEPLLLPALDVLGLDVAPHRHRATAAATVDEALHFLRGRAPSAWFLVVHLDELLPPIRGQAEAPAENAAEALVRLDAQVRRLLAAIPQEAWVVVAGTVGPAASLEATDLGQATLHVPLVIRRPRELRPRPVDRVVRTNDLFPTMLALAGTAPKVAYEAWPLTEALARPALADTCDREPPPPECATGERTGAICRDVCPPALRATHKALEVPWGGPLPARPALSVGTGATRGHLALRLDRWKLTRTPAADRLYDLVADPHEHTDLLAADPGELSSPTPRERADHLAMLLPDVPDPESPAAVDADTGTETP